MTLPENWPRLISVDGDGYDPNACGVVPAVVAEAFWLSVNTIKAGATKPGRLTGQITIGPFEVAIDTPDPAVWKPYANRPSQLPGFPSKKGTP